MTALLSALMRRNGSVSWRRLTATVWVQCAAIVALWCDRLDGPTWATLAVTMAGVYIGSDTLEKVVGHTRRPAPEPTDLP